MSKTRKVLDFCDCGKCYTVIRHEGDINPYWIYHHYSDYGVDGFLHHHKKLMEKYGDMQSCFWWFLQNVYGKGY